MNDVMRELVDLQRELVGAMRDESSSMRMLQSNQAMQMVLVQALMETHPDPVALGQAVRRCLEQSPEVMQALQASRPRPQGAPEICE